MCLPKPKPPAPPPPPAPTPPPPPKVAPPPVTESKATTRRVAPRVATSTSEIQQPTRSAGEEAIKKKRGRASLRIPLASSGLGNSGLNFPS